MGDKYRVFKCGLWNEDWFVEAEQDVKIMFIWLFTNDRITPAGLIKTSIGAISGETGITPPRIREILKSLSPKVMWWPEDGIIWVRKFLKNQQSSQNFIRSAVISAKSFQPVYEEFIKEYPDVLTVQSSNLKGTNQYGSRKVASTDGGGSRRVDTTETLGSPSVAPTSQTPQKEVAPTTFIHENQVAPTYGLGSHEVDPTQTLGTQGSEIREKERDALYSVGSNTEKAAESKPNSAYDACSYFSELTTFEEFEEAFPGETPQKISMSAERMAYKFFDHYQAIGWRTGSGVPMHDWRAAARNWVSRELPKVTASPPAKSKPSEPEISDFDREAEERIKKKQVEYARREKERLEKRAFLDGMTPEQQKEFLDGLTSRTSTARRTDPALPA